MLRKRGGNPRVIPPRRIENLRKGGGRKNVPGWTEQKRRTSRDRFNDLRPYIKTGVTVLYPSAVTPEQLRRFDKLNRNFCKEKRIPARCVWEGPGPHQHIALGIPQAPDIESKWRARLTKAWQDGFGEAMPEKSFYWNPDIQPDKIASYLSKTRDQDTGMKVKARFQWLVFNPYWEVNFRSFVSSNASTSARGLDTSEFLSPEKESDSVSPHYTREVPERESENLTAMSCFGLVDLWEASGIRLEQETLGDVLRSLPTYVEQLSYMLENEPWAVSQALMHHENGNLIAAYTSERSNALVCLVTDARGLGERLERRHLNSALSRPVYYFNERHTQ